LTLFCCIVQEEEEVQEKRAKVWCGRLYKMHKQGFCLVLCVEEKVIPVKHLTSNLNKH